MFCDFERPSLFFGHSVRHIPVVIFKYYYANGAAGIHLLRFSRFSKLNVRLKYCNTVEILWKYSEIQLKYSFLQKIHLLHK